MPSTWDKAKLTATDLGKPRALVNADGATGKLYLGRILGELQTVKPLIDAQGRESTQLVGRFKGVPATPITIKAGDPPVDTTVDAIVSTKAFLPINTQNLLVEELAKDGVSMVQFAVDIHVEKASNPAGYIFHVTPLFPINGADSDPFAAISARVAAAHPATTTHTADKKEAPKAA